MLIQWDFPICCNKCIAEKKKKPWTVMNNLKQVWKTSSWLFRVQVSTARAAWSQRVAVVRAESWSTARGSASWSATRPTPKTWPPETSSPAPWPSRSERAGVCVCVCVCVRSVALTPQILRLFSRFPKLEPIISDGLAYAVTIVPKCTCAIKHAVRRIVLFHTHGY